jgi:MFS family permease
MASDGVIELPALRERIADTQRYKFVLLFFLYVSQSIPVGFFVMAIPVLLRSGGGSLAYIGVLNLLLLPHIFRFSWAPYVDRYFSYRGWILTMQTFCIATMVSIAFFDWVEQFWIIFGICMAYTIVSTTQDIGVDGLAIRALSHDERPTGNALQVAGQYLGTIVGGGAMIMLFNKLGLPINIGIIVVVLAIPMLLLIPYREPSVPREEKIHPGFRTIVEVVRRPGMMKWMLVLVAYYFGPLMSGNLVRPLLVDRKVSLETIGFLFGVMSPLLAIAGCGIAPWIIRKLGRRMSMIVFTVVAILQIACDSLMGFRFVGLETIYACAAFLAFTSGFFGILAYAIAMDKSRSGSAGTDFTVQITLLIVGQMIAGLAAGFLGQKLGYQPVFAIAIVMQIVVLVSIIRFVRAEDLEGPGNHTDHPLVAQSAPEGGYMMSPAQRIEPTGASND